MPVRTALFSDPDATSQHARELAKCLVAGDTVLLSGDVGAGKTHFARSLVQSVLKYPEDVPSPTFTLVQTYATSRGDIWHADLYRITSAEEIEELGLMDAFDTAICLIEWPDRLGTQSPKSALHLTFAAGEKAPERTLTAEWQNPAWDEKLTAWLI